MTYPISDVTRRVVYSGSAGVGPYNFTFEILTQTDIAVYKNSTLLTLTTDYTVTINVNGTGSITLVSAATGSDKITIVGDRGIQRTTDFVTGGDLFANTLNQELDALTIYSQQIDEKADRGLKAPVTDPTDINMTLPVKASRLGKVLSFDATTGDPIASITASEVSNAQTYATNAAASAAAAAASYDSFDDRYLGAKATDPTVDNDGNALIDGALYFDTTNNVMKVYDLGGTVWKRTTPTTSDQANIDAAVANASNINQVASDTVAINAASANATSAANSATAAASSATSAANSAASASAVVLGNEPVRASVRPTLLLDFANVKQLDPRITFTRASTGTFYDGKTTVKAEENLLLRSQEFDEAAWLRTNATVTANTTSGPDGAGDAETITDDATNSSHRIRQVISIPVNTTFTLSVFLKKGTSNFGYIAISDPNSAQRYFAADFNLDTGAVRASGAGTSGTLTSASITASANGWYRCVITGQVAVVSASTSAVIGVSDGTSAISTLGFVSYAGTGSTILAWGAQLEQRSSVTAYTYTTTQAITNYVPVLQTAASGVARFEHNPVTGESLGLEIEESRTNLLTYSDQFDNAAWTKARSNITANTIVAPDGTLTGDKFFDDTTAASNHNLRATAAITSGTTLTGSVYVKQGEVFNIGLAIGDSSNSSTQQRVIFDLQALTTTTEGTVNPLVTSPTNITFTHVGNQWYRVGYTATVTDTSAKLWLFLNTGSTTYDGNGYRGLYIWGAQLEAGAFATSYIPTVAAQVTRAADVATMTGANFSSWYRADEGTFLVQASRANVGTTAGIVQVDDGTNNNRIAIQTSNTEKCRIFVVTNNVTQTQVDSAASLTVNTPFAAVMSYASNDVGSALNGTSLTTDTSATLPVVSTLRIGQGTTVLSASNLRRIVYYPERLAAAELQGMTTV